MEERRQLTAFKDNHILLICFTKKINYHPFGTVILHAESEKVSTRVIIKDSLITLLN